MNAPANTLDDNSKRLQSYLERFKKTGIHNLIDGETKPGSSGVSFETHSHVDESLLALTLNQEIF